MQVYRCTGCGALLRPRPGDCCIFCAYGSEKCPSQQGEVDAALGAVPQATKERDLAYKALKDWMNEYRAFARAQFKDRPEVLKRLLLA